MNFTLCCVNDWLRLLTKMGLAVAVFDHARPAAPPRRLGFVHRAAARVLFPILSSELVVNCRVTHILVHSFGFFILRIVLTLRG